MNLPYLLVFGLALLVSFFALIFLAEPPFEGERPAC